MTDEVSEFFEIIKLKNIKIQIPEEGNGYKCNDTSEKDISDD